MDDSSSHDNPDEVDGPDPRGVPARTDLGLLDPTRNQARFDVAVRSIVADVLAERSRTQGDSRSALASLMDWSRPMLAAAAVVLVVAGSALAVVRGAPNVSVAGPASLAESAGIPARLVDLATTNRALTTAELIDAFETVADSTGGK